MVEPASSPSNPPRAAGTEDPLAARVDWFPLLPGGTVILRPRLVSLAPDRVEFRRPPYTNVVIVVALGLMGWCAFLVASALVPPWTLERLSLAAIPISLWLGVAALVLRLAGTQPRFDRKAGAFTRGRALLASPPLRVPFSAIHAVQLLREWCESSRNSFCSYEVNLVLRNGRRVHVVDRSGHDAVRGDARRLAGFLGVPLWDASDVDAPHPPGMWNATVRFLNRWLPPP